MHREFDIYQFLLEYVPISNLVELKCRRYLFSLWDQDDQTPKQWDCQVCQYPLDSGETALTTDPDDLPNVYCGTVCATQDLNETIEVVIEGKH